MPNRIKEDHKKFRDVVSGRTRQELKRLIKSGAIVRQRPKGGKVTISIPQIDIPHFVFGDNGEGLGRGPGKEGDTIGRDPKPGKGKGKAGDQPGDGINISIDMQWVLKFLEDEIQLPPMKPKPTATFEEIKIKYNNLSKNGPESLRHTRKTLREALKRNAMMGDLGKKIVVPGSAVPMNVINVINSDRRYRQYTELKIPSSNAVIFFARDCSGSMDDYKCDIVSDMSWWIECWMRKFYAKVDRCYMIHDTEAEEVDEEKFYTYRQGGGTRCSSVFDKISEQLENRYPPEKYNIYLFYFTDGDNWDNDNERMTKIIQEKLGPAIINMIGITQVCSWNYDQSVKATFDNALQERKLDSDQVRTANIGSKNTGGDGWNTPEMDEEDRNQQIFEAIKTILKPRAYAEVA